MSEAATSSMSKLQNLLTSNVEKTLGGKRRKPSKKCGGMKPQVMGGKRHKTKHHKTKHNKTRHHKTRHHRKH